MSEMILDYIISVGGIGGLLALIMFFSYRYLVRQMREDRKYMEDRMTKVIDDYGANCKSHTDAMIKHTQVLTELIVYLKAKNGNRRR